MFLSNSNRMPVESRQSAGWASSALSVSAVLLTLGCAQSSADAVSTANHNDGHLHHDSDHQHATEHADGDQSGVFRTVKPGAAVTFSHQFQSPPTVNENGTVAIMMEHSYDRGTLTMQATGSDALFLGMAPPVATMPINGKGPLVWPISFRPTGEGVHQINLLVEVSGAGGEPESRSYAVRFSVGDPGDARKERPDPTVFQAVETIQ